MNATPWGEREIVRMGVDLTMYRTKKASSMSWLFQYGGGGRIRTIEGGAGRFTVCSLWPLGNPSEGIFILRKCFPNTAFQVFSYDIITRKNMVEGDGFEPSKAEPADLQSAPFGHSGTPPGYFYT